MVKSAYSFSTKKEKIENHIIVVWVDNEAGVLARVVGLFSGRGYNIDSLAVAEVDKKKNISRITIATSGTPQVLQQIKLQLGKLVPVHKVADFPSNTKTLLREMALLKVVASDSLTISSDLFLSIWLDSLRVSSIFSKFNNLFEFIIFCFEFIISSPRYL